MSDFGSSLPDNWLTDTELADATCAGGSRCLCTGRTCRMVREIRERRAADSQPESHRVQVARCADSLPVSAAAESMVDALMAKSTTAATSKRKLMPALTAEEREALEWVRHQCKRAEHGHPTFKTQTALAVLSKLLGEK